MEKSCKSCIYNDDGLCDKKGYLTENAPAENVEPAPVVSSVDEDAIKIKAERDIYKKLYEDMLDRMVGKTA